MVKHFHLEREHEKMCENAVKTYMHKVALVATSQPYLRLSHRVVLSVQSQLRLQSIVQHDTLILDFIRISRVSPMGVSVLIVPVNMLVSRPIRLFK